MNKKDLITPIAIISLSIVFAIICVAVFLTKGKSDFWISKKFKIGAILLTFTSLVACKPEVSCYVPVAENWIELDSLNYENYEIELDSSENQKITGTLGNASDSIYSFNFADTLGNTIYKENLVADDGKIDSDNEKFTISLGEYLIPGKYLLFFYMADATNQENAADIGMFNVKIVE